MAPICLDYDTNQSLPWDRSMRNTFRLHLWNRNDLDDSNDSKYEADTRLIMNVIRHSTGKMLPAPELNIPDLLESDASVVILDSGDLEHHCRKYHGGMIKNWLVAGTSWHMCLHHRPMGLAKLAGICQNNSMNFYVATWSVVDESNLTITEQHIENDWLEWEKIQNFGYRLVKNPS
jgi:hypothetical protein